MMFRRMLLSLVFFSTVMPIFAQLAMVLTPNQQTYMQYEAIYMHLRIRNDSGRPVVFGQNKQLQAKLFFEVSDINGRVLPELSGKSIILTQGKVINPGQIGDIVLKFSSFCKLHQKGIYRIHAYISHPLFKDQFKSNDVRIDISSGIPIWKRTIGVPDGKINAAGDTVSHDSLRTYTIRKIIDGKGQFYYCTLEDKDKLYQVFRMGPAIGIDKPACLVDMSGALHILINIAPKIYKYYKLDITGELLEADKYYKITKTRPALLKSKDGKIFVSGGAPALPNVDFLVREKSFKTALEDAG